MSHLARFPMPTCSCLLSFLLLFSRLCVLFSAAVVVIAWLGEQVNTANNAVEAELSGAVKVVPGVGEEIDTEPEPRPRPGPGLRVPFRRSNSRLLVLALALPLTLALAVACASAPACAAAAPV